jgi:hypothetical protein
MPIERVLCPERLRSVPAQFSGVDHRLVRDRHIDRCDAPAGALYLFLVTVADAQGLSYYSDSVLARRLSMAPARLAQARADLLRAGLIAYQRPLYQVLALEGGLPVEACALGVEERGACIERLRAALGRAPRSMMRCTARSRIVMSDRA